MPSHPDATDTYRAIVTRRGATEIMLSQADAGWTLPRVQTQKHQRIAEQLTQEIRKVWGLETLCLLVPSLGAYKWLKARPLTLTKSAADPKLWKFCALCWSAQGNGLSNDFERPVFRRHPRLGQIKRALLQRGAAEASLAGSGSAVFGVFPSPAQARRAAVGFPDDQTFVCETLSRDRYVRKMQGTR